MARVPKRFALITGLGYAFVDDDQSFNGKAVNQIVVRLYASALKRCQTVFFQNHDDETLFRMLRIIGKNSNSIVVNGSGVPISDYAFEPAPQYEAPVFFLMARLIAAKGVRIYAEAAKQIKQTHPEARFIIAGSLDTNPDAISEQELNSWIYNDIIDYRGRLSDVKPMLKECSVYVLPSYYREGVSRSILEALSVGRAVITTDAPGCHGRGVCSGAGTGVWP